MKSRRRDGTLVETYDGEGAMIDKLYGTALGRRFLKVLISPVVSRCAGVILDGRISTLLIRPFIKKNKLDLSEYPKQSYRSFNDFFTRVITPGKRPVDGDETKLVSPCDGKLTVFPLEKDAHFTIKGVDYTLEALLKSRKLAERYLGGWGVLLRLTVDDYHRYIYPVSGKKGRNYHIPGVYHTVNPRAAKQSPIYRENTREYTLMKTERFGTVLMMEIGAMLVGRIKNLHEHKKIMRGEEKGYFEFGGSSIILLLQAGKFEPDQDLILHSRDGEETIVRQGEAIGTCPEHF